MALTLQDALAYALVIAVVAAFLVWARSAFPAPKPNAAMLKKFGGKKSKLAFCRCRGDSRCFRAVRGLLSCLGGSKNGVVSQAARCGVLQHSPCGTVRSGVFHCNSFGRANNALCRFGSNRKRLLGFLFFGARGLRHHESLQAGERRFIAALHSVSVRRFAPPRRDNRQRG